jgi:iron complex transport system substrate-binding protein
LPDVLIVAPCGIGLERADDETRGLASLPGWGELPAVRYGRVFAADGNALFNRPSQRIVDSLEVLAEILHPNLFRGIVSDPERLYRRIELSRE